MAAILRDNFLKARVLLRELLELRGTVRKLGVRNRGELLSFALSHNLTDDIDGLREQPAQTQKSMAV